MQMLNAAWGVIRPFAQRLGGSAHTRPAVQPEQAVVQPEVVAVRAERPAVRAERPAVRAEQAVVQPEVVAVRAEQAVVQPERPVVQPWSKAQVADWLGSKGWRFENDRRASKSRVRFARKRERQDLPRRTYDVVGMSVEMGEAVPEGMILWVNKQ